MKEFADESVTVFTALLYVQRGNSPFMLNSRTFTRRGTPKAKSGMIWIALTEAFKLLQYSSIFRIQVVKLRVIGGCFNWE